MKRVEVKLGLPVVAPLLDLIKRTVDDLERPAGRPPARCGTWTRSWARRGRASCSTSQNEDCRRFLALFDREFFASGMVAFDDANAESVLRACAAIRLRLRDRELRRSARRRDRRRRRGRRQARRCRPESLHVLCLPGHAAGADHPAPRLGDPGGMMANGPINGFFRSRLTLGERIVPNAPEAS